MKPAILIPAFAAVTCLEFAIVFLALYVKVGRRPENLAAGGLSAFLAAMLGCALMLQTAHDRYADLFWYRAHFFCVYALIAVLIHFLSLLTRQSLPRPLTPLRLYLIMGALWLPAFSPRVIHLIPAGTLPAHFDDATWGAFYPLYVGAPLAAAGIACVVAVRSLRRLRALPRSQETDFAPLDSEVQGVVLGAASVLVAGVVEFVQQVCFPQINVALNPRALAAVVLCATMAWALGREIRRNEDQRRRLDLEKARSEELACVRLQATYDAQHQVKNGLVAIELPLRNALRAMQRGESAPPQARVADALGEVTRLFQTLDVMLNTARLAAGEPPQLGKKIPTDVASLVHAACERRAERERERQAAEGAGKEPKWVFDFQLEEEVSPVFLHAEVLEQVLAVLLDNALKFSPAGGRVTLRLRASKDTLYIEVADQGIGIAPEDLKRVSARPFYRAPMGKHEIAGTGLGLNLARRLIEAQGGRFWAESTLGAGSTFHIALPLEPAGGIAEKGDCSDSVIL